MFKKEKICSQLKIGDKIHVKHRGLTAEVIHKYEHYAVFNMIKKGKGIMYKETFDYFDIAKMKHGKIKEVKIEQSRIPKNKDYTVKDDERVYLL